MAQNIRIFVKNRICFYRIVRINANPIPNDFQTRDISSQTTDTCGQTTGPQIKSNSDFDLNFDNTREAFKSKTTSELIRALLVLKLCSFDLIVNNNSKVRSDHRLIQIMRI